MENKSGVLEAVQCATYIEGEWGGDMDEAGVCTVQYAQFLVGIIHLYSVLHI